MYAHCAGFTQMSWPAGLNAAPLDTLTRGPLASESTATWRPQTVPKPSRSRASHLSRAER